MLSNIHESNDGEKLNDEQAAKLKPIILHSVNMQSSIVVFSRGVTMSVHCSNLQDLNVKYDSEVPLKVQCKKEHPSKVLPLKSISEKSS